MLFAKYDVWTEIPLSVLASNTRYGFFAVALHIYHSFDFFTTMLYFQFNKPG